MREGGREGGRVGGREGGMIYVISDHYLHDGMIEM